MQPKYQARDAEDKYAFNLEFQNGNRPPDKQYANLVDKDEEGELRLNKLNST